VGAAFGSSDEDAISAINVTPLVDVVLVLLIILLVAAPVIYNSAIKVELPKAETGDKSQSSAQLNLTIAKDGALHWNEDAITWDDLKRRLAALGPEAPAKIALIRADETVQHGVVVRAMDFMREAGLAHIGISVAEDAGGAN
jgi:biopolymer transport protein ExbD